MFTPVAYSTPTTMEDLNAYCGSATTNPGHHRMLTGGAVGAGIYGNWDCAWYANTPAIQAADEASAKSLSASFDTRAAAGQIQGLCSDAVAAQQGLMSGLKNAMAAGPVILPLFIDSNPWSYGSTTDAAGAACQFDANKAGASYKAGLYAPTALIWLTVFYFLFLRKGS